MVWGCQSDTLELVEIGFPVFSYGRWPGGPQRLDPRAADALTSARFGENAVGAQWVVFADDDGVLFAPSASAVALIEAARAIGERERLQAGRVRAGESLRAQFRFADYLARREREDGLTLRQHLRAIGAAIEE